MRKRRKSDDGVCWLCFSSAFLLPILFIVYYFGLVVRNGPSPPFVRTCLGRTPMAIGREPSPKGNVGYLSIAPLANNSNYFGVGGSTGAVAMGGATEAFA